jgi:hypothetical protein
MNARSPVSSFTPFLVRTLKAGMAVLLAGLAAQGAAGQTKTPASAEIIPWKSSGSVFYINGPLRFNLGFFDQKGTPRVAEIGSLTADQLASLPPTVTQAKDNPVFRTGYFDSLWSAMRASVCQDVQNAISKLVVSNGNTPYDFQPCIMNKKGWLSVNFQETWTNSALETVNGRRVRFIYQAPLNGIIFWVTSAHTCHHGGPCSPFQPEDPVYSYVFEVNIVVTCTSTQPNATEFTLPVTCTNDSQLVGDGLLGGDVTGALNAALAQWATQTIGEAASVGVSGGGSLPEAAAAFIAKGLDVAAVSLGTAIAAIGDEHLRDQVSAELMGFVGSQTLASNSTNVTNDLNSLFKDLYPAWLGGLRPFAIAIAVEKPDIDLDLGLVYPLPARPQIENKTAANNVSLFAPTLAVSQPEVVAGQVLPVTATFFKGNYVNALTVAWNKTVLGPTTSHITWGPPPQTITTSALTFDATNLKPATGYEFYVQECDAITCAPTSELLKTTTEAAGTGDITFWLDNNTAQKLGGTQVAAAGGSFQTNVLIPAATTPGVHLLHAGGLNSPTATATITVCQVGGCGPSVAVVNTSNGTLYPPGSVVEVGLPVVLRGSKFTPGNSAWIWVDSIQGTKAGAASVGPLGNFQANFTMPMVAPGPHKLLAVELKPGTKPPPTPKGKTPVFPPQDFVSAAVAVYVQAQAQ